MALVESYVEHYNNVRSNSAIGYITPKDMLAGRQQEIHAERDRKLEAARKQRWIRRKQAALMHKSNRSRSVWRGAAEFQTSGLATNETRHVNAALLIADTDFVLLVVIALEYSLAPLKSRPRLPEWLQVPLRYRETLESSPGMRPQHQGSPPRRLPRQAFR